VCALVTSGKSNGAAPSGPGTWARLFDLSGDECAPETRECVCVCVCVCVCEPETEAPSGQPGGRLKACICYFFQNSVDREIAETEERYSRERRGGGGKG